MDDSMDFYMSENAFEMDTYYSYAVEQQLGLMHTKENYVYSLRQVRREGEVGEEREEGEEKEEEERKGGEDISCSYELKTALHYAASFGKLKMVRDLVNYGKDINVSSSAFNSSALLSPFSSPFALLFPSSSPFAPHPPLLNSSPFLSSLHLLTPPPLISPLAPSNLLLL
jgi:hypothetical protein